MINKTQSQPSTNFHLVVQMSTISYREGLLESVIEIKTAHRRGWDLVLSEQKMSNFMEDVPASFLPLCSGIHS